MLSDTPEHNAAKKTEPWWTDVYHMRPNMAARYLGLSPSTLAKLRMQQNRLNGPIFSKIAGMVVYRRTDLDSWLEENQVTDHHETSVDTAK